MWLQSANLALRLGLELCLLAALGYWGFQTGQGLIAKIGLGIGAPLVAAIVWGAFLAPQASVSLPDPLRLALEVAMFGLGVGALAVTGHPVLASAFGVIAGINRVLMQIWGQ